MMLRGFATTLMAVAIVFLLALPALAHGENDARPLLRDSQVGSYTVSLWQVVGDQNSALPPHLIVIFAGEVPAMSDTVSVVVGDQTVHATPSVTTSGGWEALYAAAEGDRVSVVVESEGFRWESESVAVPSLPGSRLPMELIIALASFFTAGTAYWLGKRATRAWRLVAVSIREG